ncbi:MAG: NADH:ubiquinone reductase (Na(+)-transporting) subunit F [Kiritimatiellia bacterium]
MARTVSRRAPPGARPGLVREAQARPRRCAARPLAGNAAFTAAAPADADGWIEVCSADKLGREDVIRFDHARRTYALYQTAEGRYHATDGVCTHGNTHLADGLVKGNLIECPKHNGRFDITDGSPVAARLRQPAHLAAREPRRPPVPQHRPAGRPGAEQKTRTFRVVSNRNVATFIKELVLEPLERFDFTPGDYLQIDIPEYAALSFRDFVIDEPYRSVWAANHVLDYAAANPVATRRNYSIASAPAAGENLRFNVRIATPPRGQDCSAGAGSSHVFSLKPGDTVTAIGPFGDFHIKPTQKEMVYIGGGAGMAPLRSHVTHLLDTLKSPRRISFWYGARSRQELFYQDHFADLARRHPNFSFQVALSEPLPEDGWTSHTGNIHEVVARELLQNHPHLAGLEFYLCGPPALIRAATGMLARLGVEAGQIAYDEF